MSKARPWSNLEFFVLETKQIVYTSPDAGGGVVARAIPVDRESPFSIERMFFSMTDSRGIISAGNSTFVEISGYSYDELLGAPHNIIRHPDMPKCVFKLLWDTIKADQPIVAYVKNMSKGGTYYWVLATVFPIEGGFLSIRIKPSCGILSKVIDLYRQVLIEEKKGLDAGLNFIIDNLKKLGFRNYQSFMATALLEEIKSRDLILEGRKVDLAGNKKSQYRQLSIESERLRDYARETFKSLLVSLEVGTSAKRSSDELLKAFKKLHLLAINMTIEAERIGQSGASLAEVSNNFEKIAKDIEDQIQNFDHSLAEVFIDLDSAQLSVCATRLQIESLEFFVNEQTAAHEIQQADRIEFEKVLQSLIKIINRTTANATQVVKELLGKVVSFRNRLRDLSVSASGMQLIRISGRIEATRNENAAGSGFLIKIEEMNSFVEMIAGQLKTISSHTENLASESDKALDLLMSTSRISSQL